MKYVHIRCLTVQEVLEDSSAEEIRSLTDRAPNLCDRVEEPTKEEFEYFFMGLAEFLQSRNAGYVAQQAFFAFCEKCLLRMVKKFNPELHCAECEPGMGYCPGTICQAIKVAFTDATTAN